MAFCTNCGSSVSDSAVFCPNCGAKLNAAAASVAEPLQNGDEKATITIPVEQSYTPPTQQSYAPPVEQSYTPPVEQSYTPPVEQSYTPPVEQSYTPPVEQSYTPLVEQSYTPPVEQSYTPPVEQSYTPPTQQSYAPNAQQGYTPNAQQGYVPNAQHGNMGGGRPPRSSMGSNGDGTKKALLIVGGILLAVILLIVILVASCGRNHGGDPMVGMWIGSEVSVQGTAMEVSDIFPDGLTLELKKGGKCELNLSGNRQKGKWKMDGSDFALYDSLVDMDGELVGSILTLYDFHGAGMNLSFEKEGGFAPDGGELLDGPGSVNAIEGFYPIYAANVDGTDMSVEDIKEAGMYDDSYIKFYINGTGELGMGDGEPIDFEYDLYNSLLITDDGEKPFVLDGDTITLEFSTEDIGYEMTLVYKLEGGSSGVAGSIQGAFGGSQGDFVSPTKKIGLNTIWFGTYKVTGREAGDYTLSVFAQIASAHSGTFFEIYKGSDFAVQEDLVASMWIDLYDDHFEAEIGDEDAFINNCWLTEEAEPFFSPTLKNGALAIEYDLEDGDDTYHISVFLREDGTPWDEANDPLPPHYNEYKAALAAGKNGAPGSEAAGADPAGGDYGKTAPDATGIVDFDTLKSAFTWLHNSTGSEGGYKRPTYEEIREKMGGANAMKTHESSWEDDYHVYIWQTEGKKDFLLISFKVQPDGSETWNSSSWSNGLND